jgi:hypothetical protein
MCPRMVVPVRVALLSSLLFACSGPPPDPPSAVVALSPATICEGDGHHTEIILDGSGSSAQLTLVPVPPEPGEPPLRFAWTLSGAAFEVVAGDLTSDVVVLTSAGDRPLHASLTVTNGSGGIATTLRTVSITPYERDRCSDDSDCDAGVCAVDLGSCIPAHTCEDDDDCDACFACDTASSRCLPRTDLTPRAPAP